MKKLLFFTMAAGFLAAITGCNVQYGYSRDWSDRDLTAVTNLTRSAEIPASLKHLNVDNRFGAIHIVGTTNESTGWVWNLTVRARTDAIAEQISSAVSCKAQLDGDHLDLTVSLPDSDAALMKEPHSIQSDFEITVPKSVAVRAQDGFGEVAIADLAASVDAINNNGRVQIWNIDGTVNARNAFGVLSVTNTGSATLQNQNGEIWAAGIHGDLGARTSFGPLKAQDVHGSAGLTNQNGLIRAVSIDGPLNARTSFGDLSAKDIGGQATLHNQNGRIDAGGITGSLEANTCFDSLIAQDVRGSASLKNQNGNITAGSIRDSLDALTSFSSLVAVGIGGPARLRDQNGDVKASQIKGDVDVETSFATLNVSDIQGNAILKDQNGEIVASGVTGSVKASTSFATMDVTGAGSKFICHNQNGAIRLRATSVALTNIEANTSFATLEVHLPPDLKPAIQAHTTFADVDSDFPVWNNPSSSDALTEMAKAAASVSLQNQNGKIRVVRE